MWVRLVLCEQEREVKGMRCWEALDLGVSQGSSVPPSLRFQVTNTFCAGICLHCSLDLGGGSLQRLGEYILICVSSSSHGVV